MCHQIKQGWQLPAHLRPKENKAYNPEKNLQTFSHEAADLPADPIHKKTQINVEILQKVTMKISLVVAISLSISNTIYAQQIFEFIRGDANDDSFVNLTDAILIADYAETGQSATINCLDAADVNDDGVVDITDYQSLIGFLFGGSAPPLYPFPNCDTDPTPDPIDCAAYFSCEGPECFWDSTDCEEPRSISDCITRAVIDPNEGPPKYYSRCVERVCFTGQIRRCSNSGGSEYLSAIAADDQATVYIDGQEIFHYDIFEESTTPEGGGTDEWIDGAKAVQIPIDEAIEPSDTNWHEIKIIYTNLYNEPRECIQDNMAICNDGLSLYLGEGWMVREGSNSPRTNLITCIGGTSSFSVHFACEHDEITLKLSPSGSGRALFIDNFQDTININASNGLSQEVKVLGIQKSSSYQDLEVIVLHSSGASDDFIPPKLTIFEAKYFYYPICNNESKKYTEWYHIPMGESSPGDNPFSEALYIEISPQELLAMEEVSLEIEGEQFKFSGNSNELQLTTSNINDPIELTSLNNTGAEFFNKIHVKVGDYSTVDENCYVFELSSFKKRELTTLMVTIVDHGPISSWTSVTTPAEAANAIFQANRQAHSALNFKMVQDETLGTWIDFDRDVFRSSTSFYWFADNQEHVDLITRELIDFQAEKIFYYINNIKTSEPIGIGGVNFGKLASDNVYRWQMAVHPNNIPKDMIYGQTHLHELGHSMSLDHVFPPSAEGEIMCAPSSGNSCYGGAECKYSIEKNQAIQAVQYHNFNY